jgi:hypothetical protein
MEIGIEVYGTNSDGRLECTIFRNCRIEAYGFDRVYNIRNLTNS